MSLIRVLLVDSCPAFLRAAAHFLAADRSVAVVGQAASYPDALKQASDLRPDVVVTDLPLTPGGDHPLNGLKDLPGSPRLVVLAVYDQPEYRDYARSLGADGFINKSEFGEQLLPLIHTWFPS
jgi:DNA-binding NarL/FixJ family response regulator